MLKNVKDVQNFLELANYYRQFVKDFARVARSLHEMMRKEIKWSWGKKQQRVFKKLKEKFTKYLVLAALDLDKKMSMEVNASDYATRGVLSMEYEDGK